MQIVCIHAHPDDAEILAGGTLALLAESGHSITMVSMTPGDCGSARLPPDQIAALRRSEAAQAASLIAADYRCAEFRDMAIFNTDDARRRVTEIVRSTRPDIVLTAAPADYHCDHEATSTLVRDACFAASAPNYLTNAPQPEAPLPAIPHLYFDDSVGGVDRLGSVLEPEFVVDVESTFETKRRMLSCHASQGEWLKKQHDIENPLSMMERWTRQRGALVGIHFGEGFRHYTGHPYPETPLLEELLGSRVIIHDRQWGSAK